MNLNFLEEQIHEELEGAKTYIDKAIESKVLHPAWSRTFANMADMEAEHANNLMKMMETFIRDMKKNEIPSTGTSSGSPLTTIKETSTVASTDYSKVTSSSPEQIYAKCMQKFGETMAYVTNMKRGL